MMGIVNVYVSLIYKIILNHIVVRFERLTALLMLQTFEAHELAQARTTQALPIFTTADASWVMM